MNGRRQGAGGTGEPCVRRARRGPQARAPKGKVVHSWERGHLARVDCRGLSADRGLDARAPGEQG